MLLVDRKILPLKRSGDSTAPFFPILELPVLSQMADDMEVDMDVFTALSSLSRKKRSSMSPHPSSIEKRPKLDAEQVAINDKISKIARRKYWQSQLDLVGGDSECREFFSDIVVIITSENLQGILPPQLAGQSSAITNNLSENELKEWKDGVRKGLKEGDWTELLSHRE